MQRGHDTKKQKNPPTFIDFLQSLQDVLHGVLITAPRVSTLLLLLPPAITLAGVHGFLLPPEVSAHGEVLQPIHSAVLDVLVSFSGVTGAGRETCIHLGVQIFVDFFFGYTLLSLLGRGDGLAQWLELD